MMYHFILSARQKRGLIMRIDKFLSNAGAGSRSQVKTDLKKGLVLVNGQAVRSADFQVDPAADTITFKGRELCLPGNRYYMLNKPMGCVSATEDPREKTVLDLFPAELRKDLFPVGRLDKDTEGLLLLTTDGALSHQLISPKKEIYKTYLVTCEKSVTKEDLLRLETGVNIGEAALTLPAKAEATDDDHVIYLSICEGRFHQVKRMLQATCNKVTRLKRVSFGPLSLDTSLKPGAYRVLSEDEVALLRNASSK